MASGALMRGMHFLSNKIPAGEYGVLITLFSIVNPGPDDSLPNGVHAADGERAGDLPRPAIAEHHPRGLVGTHAVLAMAAAGGHVVFSKANSGQLAPVQSVRALAAAAGDVVFPVYADVCRGHAGDSKISCGSAGGNILNGVFRVSAAVFIVFVLHGMATGIMTAVFIGLLAATAVGVWQTRSLWAGAGGGIRPARAFAAGDSLDARFCRDTIFVFRGHRFCGHLFWRGLDGDLRGGGNAVARAVVAGAAAGGGDVSQNRPQHGQSRKSLTCSAWFWREQPFCSLRGVLGLWLLGPWVVDLFFRRNTFRKRSRSCPGMLERWCRWRWRTCW